MSVYSSWKREELQELVLLMGSKGSTKEYTRLSTEEFNNLWESKSLLAPPEYARSLSIKEISSIIADYRPIDRAAERLGVSPPFLSSLIAKTFPPISSPCPYDIKTLTDEDFIRLYTSHKTVENLAPTLACGEEAVRSRLKKLIIDIQVPVTKDLVERLGTVSVISRVTGLSISGVRKALQENGWLDLISYQGMGNSTGSGRRAELFFLEKEKEIDPNQVIDDMNQINGPTASFDFLHPKYQRVNVKSSLPYRYKSKTRLQNPVYYKIGTRGLENCDFVAVVLMDKKGDPQSYKLFTSDEIQSFNTSTVRLQVIKSKWILGRFDKDQSPNSPVSTSVDTSL